MISSGVGRAGRLSGTDQAEVPVAPPSSPSCGKEAEVSPRSRQRASSEARRADEVGAVGEDRSGCGLR